MKLSPTKIKESGENTEIIIVDPEAEYSVIGRAFGGEMIDIAPDSQTYLNVLDLSEENMDEDPVKVKSEFLLSLSVSYWIEKWMGEKNRLSTELRDSLISHLKSLLWKNGSLS